MVPGGSLGCHSGPAGGSLGFCGCCSVAVLVAMQAVRLQVFVDTKVVLMVF